VQLRLPPPIKDTQLQLGVFYWEEKGVAPERGRENNCFPVEEGSEASENRGFPSGADLRLPPPIKF